MKFKSRIIWRSGRHSAWGMSGKSQQFVEIFLHGFPFIFTLSYSALWTHLWIKQFLTWSTVTTAENEVLWFNSWNSNEPFKSICFQNGMTLKIPGDWREEVVGKSGRKPWNLHLLLQTFSKETSVIWKQKKADLSVWNAKPALSSPPPLLRPD